MSAEIDAETLGNWLAEGRPLTILDVRPADQRAEWAIPGSVHADVYEAIKAGNDASVEALDLPKDVPVVTVCAMGRASRKAADILAGKGMRTYSLAGGMKAWSFAWNVAEVPIQVPGTRLIQVRRAGKGCLSYMLSSAGEAVILDPSLQPEVYLRLARESGAKIKSVLDTHIHADHFSRSRSLAELAGAESIRLPDGEGMAIGSLFLKAAVTPGHTPESTCYVLEDHAIFTGDTLFLDSVGRPDLLAGFDPREQAKLLHRSLARLLQLPGKAWVLPAHHPSAPAFDRVPIAAKLAGLRDRNVYLRMGEAEFIERVTAGGNAPPPNFETIVQSNRTGDLPDGDWQSLEAGPNRCARA